MDLRKKHIHSLIASKKNHHIVEGNVEIQALWPFIKHEKLRITSDLKNRMIDEAHFKKNQLIILKRQKYQDDMKKWDEYRNLKRKAIAQFEAYHAKKVHLKTLVAMIRSSTIIHSAHQSFLEARRLRDQARRQLRAARVISKLMQ